MEKYHAIISFKVSEFSVQFQKHLEAAYGFKKDDIIHPCYNRVPMGSTLVPMGRGGPGHLWAGACEATRGHEAAEATRHSAEGQDHPWIGGGRWWGLAIGCVRFRTAVMNI